MPSRATTEEDLAPELLRPARWESGVIVCSPHSGRDYPQWFLDESHLTMVELRSSEDAFMDRMIRPALAAGAVTLTARVPRSIVDLNRAAQEFDPLTLTCRSGKPASPRALAGLGVIPRVVAGGRPIRARPIALAEAKRRVETYWRPYHSTLRGLIDEARARFGGAIVLDMHSMPHDAISHLVGPLPQVVLGDRHGQGCGPVLRDQLAGLIREAGFRFRLNAPFSGAYMVSNYGRPAQNVHVMQIEIDRAMYLDAQRMQPSAGYEACAARVGRFLERAARLHPSEGAASLAAE